MEYTSRSSLKDKLHISQTDTTQDTFLDSLIIGSSAYIDTKTHRRFGASGVSGSTDYTITGEPHDGTLSDGLYCDQMDVRSITSVQIQDPFNPSNVITIPSQSYAFFPGTGRIKFGTGPNNFNRINSSLYQGLAYGYQTILLSYIYGIIDIPSDIELACLDICAASYVYSKSQGLKLERMGEYQIGYSEKYFDNIVNRADLFGILNSYKKIRV